MKAIMKEIRTDLSAAVTLGHPEAVEFVLESLLQIPKFAGNHKLEEHFVVNQLVPLGVLLAKSLLSLQDLIEMTESDTTVYRVIASTALLHRWSSGTPVDEKSLLYAANDPREEVRHAIVHSLRHRPEDNPQAVLELVRDWNRTDSPRLKIALSRVFPAVYPVDPEYVLETAYQFSLLGDFDINRALVESLTEIARSSHAQQIIDHLRNWSNKPDPNLWVICKSLSSSWVIEYADQADEVLKNLEATRGKSEIIEKTKHTLQTLRREMDNQ